eukprot:Polyplicarium_translucidae@DN2495_c0_g1_i4.p1
MGNYLAVPISSKRSVVRKSGSFKFASCEMQGWRTSMEDAHVACALVPPDAAPMIHLFAVFDGHGGPHIARFAANHIVRMLTRSALFRDGHIDVALRAAFMMIDEFLYRDDVQLELEQWAKLSQGDYASLFENSASLVCTTPVVPRLEPTDPSIVKLEVPYFGPSDPDDVPPSTEAADSDYIPDVQFDDVAPVPRDPSEPPLVGEDREPSDADTGSTQPVSVVIPETPSRRRTSSGRGPPSPPSTASSSGPAYVPFAFPGRGGSAVCREPREPTRQTSGGWAGRFERLKRPLQSGSLTGFKNAISSLLSSSGGASSIPRLFVPPNSPNSMAMLAGCTAVAAVVTDQQIIVANSGDSRCVLCRGDVAIDLSNDHKPSLPDERMRIYSAGGFLEMGRVNGNLNLSRAIGDLLYKQDSSLPPERQILTAFPDVFVIDISPADEFLLVGCDGIWENLSSQDVVNFIRMRINVVDNLSEILESLLNRLLSPSPAVHEHGCDNMTAILVDLKPETRHFDAVARVDDEPVPAIVEEVQNVTRRSTGSVEGLAASMIANGYTLDEEAEDGLLEGGPDR